MRIFNLCVFAVMLSVFAAAAPPPDFSQMNNEAETKLWHNEAYINANNILMFVTNHANFGRDLDGIFGYDYGTFYPFNTVQDILDGTLTSSVLYAGGIWMGGLVDGQIRVAIAEYDDEYVPGPMAGGTYQPDNPSFKVYKLYKDSLVGNPNDDYLNWPVDQGAPVNNLGEPLMLGDQMLWSVYNDAHPMQHGNNAGNTQPLGIEVQQTVWAVENDGNMEMPPDTALPVSSTGHSPVIVEIEVIEPELLTGDSYMVVVDSVEGFGAIWNLINTTTGELLLANQTNFSADNSSPVVDHFRVRVYDPTEPGTWWEWEGSTRPITGLDWGGSLFFGGVGILDEFWGNGTSLTEDDLVSVEIRWVEDGAGQSGYCYRRDLGYAFDGMHPDQNFEIWDITANPSRQLDFAFVEWFNPTDDAGQSADSIWNPGEQLNIDGTYNELGGREYWFILNSEYTGVLNPAYAVGFGFEEEDAFYAGWVMHRLDDGKPDPGDILRFVHQTDYPGIADTFTFTATPFAGPSDEIIETTIYMRYRLYNKGGNTINDFYISLWTDSDLGQFTDDLVGCDTLDDIFFSYNGDPYDNQFGSAVPAVGFKVLKGPVVPSSGDTAYFDGNPMPGYKNMGMSAFNKYINGTDPDDRNQTYYYMQGLTRYGAPLPNGSRYAVPGDPVTGVGDIDFDPGDRRMMASFGPIDFNPGDSQYVLVKMAVGQGPDRLTSITVLKEILNFPPYMPPTELMVAIRPDPQYGLFLYGMDPVMDTIFITRQGADPVGDIDHSSLMINESIEPTSTTILPSHPEFNGEVQALVFPAAEFIMGYGLPWDVTEVTYSVSGNFGDETPLLLYGSVDIIGHRAGDANGDGFVNVGDAVYLIRHVFMDGPAPLFECLGDANCDERVNVADAVTLINYIFGEGPSPRQECCH
jgi:hypothetical protein